MLNQETTVDSSAEVEAVKTETEGAEVEKTEIQKDAPETQAAEDAPGEDVDSELKTVRKALDKRNRYINNQRNKIRALEAEMEKLKSSYGKNTIEAPKMEKFESVIDYMDAKGTHTLEQKLAEQAHNSKIEALKAQQDMALEQRTQEVSAQVNELISINPDFAKTIKANVNVISAMPPHVERLMAEIDDAPAATYALVKEGRLQDLYYMRPEIAAAHLVHAEIRGKQYLLQSAPKPQQPAPKPIGSLKGSGKSSKSYSDMSPDELAKRFLK